MTRAPRRLLPPTAGATQVEQMRIDTFARRLHAELTKRGWSQSDLASRLFGRTTDAKGNSVAAKRDRVSVWLSSKAYPDPHNLQRIADVLEIPIEELAPDATAAAVERERPEVAFTAAPGHPDKVYLVIHKLLPMSLAAKIVTMIADNEGQK